MWVRALDYVDALWKAHAVADERNSLSCHMREFRRPPVLAVRLLVFAVFLRELMKRLQILLEPAISRRRRKFLTLLRRLLVAPNEIDTRISAGFAGAWRHSCPEILLRANCASPQDLSCKDEL